MTDWTDDRVEQLRGLHRNGLSATAISAEMSLTRNAVIGKLHRLGLVRDTERPVDAWDAARLKHLKLLHTKGATLSRMAAVLQSGIPVVRRQLEALGLKPIELKPKPVTLAAEAASALLPPRPAEPALVVPAGPGQAFLRAKRNCCRFPLWPDYASPRADAAFVCGEPVMWPDDVGARGSYCGEHYRRTIARAAA